MGLEVVLWIAMFVLLAMGTPIFVSLGVSTLLVMLMSDLPLGMIPLDLLKVSEMFPLLAVVGFVFAGSLMERGGIAAQIVDVASILVGRIRGGLGIVTIVGCMFFAAMIGSGPGTVAAMGSLMIPAMVRRGYSAEYAAGVCATGGTLGILIPPSNPMIVYGVIANVSISTLFMAGFVPGFLVGLVLISTAYILARRAGYQGSMHQYTAAELFQAIKKNIWAMMTPVVILGGIYAGICTPVEASVIAVFYSFFVGAFINKKLNFKEFVESVKLTNMTTATIIIVVGVSVLFGRFLTIYQIPQKLAEWMLTISSNPYPIMAMIMVLLFFLGMFMETLATIVILAPIFMPVIEKVGIDPVFFGIMWVMNNEVALLSPPLGVNLFIAMNLSGLPLEKVSRGALPYLIALASLIFIMIAFQDIPLILPRLIGGYTG